MFIRKLCNRYRKVILIQRWKKKKKYWSNEWSRIWMNLSFKIVIIICMYKNILILRWEHAFRFQLYTATRTEEKHHVNINMLFSTYKFNFFLQLKSIHPAPRARPLPLLMGFRPLLKKCSVQTTKPHDLVFSFGRPCKNVL